MIKTVMKESELDTVFDNVTYIITEELKPFGLSPTHIELLGRNAGVKGDNGLRGWTASFSAARLHEKSSVPGLQWDLLKKIQQRIVGEIQEITRVLYEI